MKPWQRLLFNWSPEKAWFLGIVYGDGNVYKSNGDYRVSICGSLSTTTKWIALLGSPIEPQEFKRSPGTYQVYINDKELVGWFETTLGMCGPKCRTLKWPEDLPAEFEVDFIRGLWDSDGSIYINRNRHKKNKGNDSPGAKFASRAGEFVAQLRSKLETNAGVPRVMVSESQDTSPTTGEVSTMYEIKYSGSSAMLLADYVYGKPPLHLVNEDRLGEYVKMCVLRSALAEQRCTCGAPVSMQGLCYECWWAKRPKIIGPGTECVAEGCTREVLALGLCGAHYHQMRRGDPDYARKSSGPCKEEGCDKPAYRKGHCDAHYIAHYRETKRAAVLEAGPAKTDAEPGLVGGGLCSGCRRLDRPIYAVGECRPCYKKRMKAEKLAKGILCEQCRKYPVLTGRTCPRCQSAAREARRDAGLYGICEICREQPVDIQKWKMCKSCYNKKGYAEKYKNLPQGSK